MTGALPPLGGSRTTVALIGCFMMLQPVSTDLYLASLPGLTRTFAVPIAGAEALAQASAILAIGPIFGPMLGSALEVRFGHRAAFLAQALVGAALLGATLARLSETNHARNPAAMAPRALLANYAFVLRSPNFRAYTLLACASYGGIFAFISGSSFVLIRVLGVPTEFFGYAFAFCVCGYLLGTLACRKLLARRSVARTLKVGASLSLASGIALVLSTLIGPPHWLGILGPAFVYFFAHAINFPCGQAGSVGPFPRHAGAASGLYGFLVMVVATLTGAWVGASYDGTVKPLAFTMAAFACVAFATTFGRIARRAPAVPVPGAMDPNV